MKIVIIAGWVGKALVIILSLVNSRLLIELVGVEGMAAQSILMSLSVWIVLLNFGIPSAVQNMISRYRAEGKDYERLKQVAASIILLIFAILLPVVIGIGFSTKYFMLIRYPEIATSTVVIFCLGLFIAGLSILFNQILFAEHRGHWPNVYPALNALFVAGLLILFDALSIKDINIVLMTFVIANTLIAVISIIQTKLFHKWCLDEKIIKLIWINCRGFALFALLSAFVLGIDYFILSRVLPPQEIAEYNILQRIFAAFSSVYTIILMSSWSKVSETLFSGQWRSVRNTIRNLLLFGSGVILTLGVLAIIFMTKIINIISNGQITTSSNILIILFLVYTLLRMWSDTFAMVLLSYNKTDILNKYIPFQALIGIFSQTLLGAKFGSLGIMLGLIISFLTTSVWILPRAFYKLAREESSV